ncbi:ribitol-5-phosphate xylosyltransferase 1-like [Diadema antillarum]|uniref:ribitol-5-phosphate xylosyltransferase 1-like n=1 Tax=Diadema antillarum TaxID=105358 RepID=UPI003A856E7B
MNRRIRQILTGVVLLYVLASVYTLYLFFTAPEVKKVNNWFDEQMRSSGKHHATKDHELEQLNKKPRPTPANRVEVFEVWSKVGLGTYTWEHILGGQLEPRLGGIWSYGELKSNGILFRMRHGDGVMPDKVPQDAENVVLILNGRSRDTVYHTKTWLDHLASYPRLARVVLMLIGNEQCQNDWVLPYMKSNGGRIDLLFIVYDTKIVNGQDILQWPLGVATYRGFPVVNSSQLHLASPRHYLCNFLGTVYPGSSREQLSRIMASHQLQNYCYVKTRKNWEPDETEASLQSYINVITQSDLTLSPVGMNPECYRIYEACALGSMPVVEDLPTEGDCLHSPFRLLKEHGAPFIYVKDWSELPNIIEEQQRLAVDEVIRRRQDLVAWYEEFKSIMKDILLGKLQGLFPGYQFR